MNRKAILSGIMVFTVAINSAFSQSKNEVSFAIKGIVVDSVSTKPVPYITVSASDAATPQIYLKRAAADSNGSFDIVLSKAGEYVLTFEAIGMQKKQVKVNIASNRKKLELGSIALSHAATQLKEVTVSASKPLVTIDLDKISYDTKSDPESQTSTVLDILKKVPMITVDTEDKIQLKSSSNFKIYMNGKPSGMATNNPSQVLKSIPASSIKSIEVITEPGAKYDAEGIGGIINIVTDHTLNGLAGTIRAGVDTRGGYNGGLYLSAKIGKFGLTTNLNYNTQNEPGGTWQGNRENFNSSSPKYILQNSFSDQKYKFYYGNLEASYEFDSLNLVSLTVNGYNGGASTIDIANTYSLKPNRDTISAFNQWTNNQSGWGGVDFTLDYQRTFKKPDKLFTMSYKLSRMPDNYDTYSDLTGLMNYPGFNEHIKYNAKGDEHTFQIDYTEPFNKKHILELGAKFILRLNTSENDYFTQKDATMPWEPMPGQPKNNLDQTQNILGAYGSYALKLDKLNFRVGLRYEQTGSKMILADTSFQVNFRNLVPSVSMTYKFNSFSTVRLSYNQRISRPGIWYLNPFVDNSNPYSISQGNPDLIPEIDNSFSLNYSYITPKLNLNTSVFSSFTNNSIERIRSLLSDSVVYNTFKNIGLNQTTGLSLYGNWQMNNAVKINLNSNFRYTVMSTNDESGLSNKGASFSVALGGQFTLPAGIKLTINGGYYSPRIELQGRNSAFYYYSLSMNKDLLNKKLNVSVFARNPFGENISYSGYTQTKEYYSDYFYTRVARGFGLTVSYRFGELKNQIKKVERTITNDDLKSGGNQGGEK